LLIGAALIMSVTTGVAQDETVHFDIAAQPLSAALEAFSSVSGYQILVSEAVPATMRSTAIHGGYPPRDALLRMVEGTGLGARFTGTRAAILVQTPAARQLLADQKRDRELYEVALQADVTSVLCRSALTRPGGYRAALDMWITPSGRVRRAELLSSTGNNLRDGQIVTMLQAMVSAPPPVALPQPTTLVFVPKPAGGRDACNLMVGYRR